MKVYVFESMYGMAAVLAESEIQARQLLAEKYPESALSMPVAATHGLDTPRILAEYFE